MKIKALNSSGGNSQFNLASACGLLIASPRF